MKRTASRVLVALFAVGVGGCANGPMTGGVIVAGQLSAAPLTMSWESSLLGASGTMKAVMPDGERFSGSYVVVKRGMSKYRVDPAWAGDESAGARGDIDDTMVGRRARSRRVRQQPPRKAIATLRGNRGSTMLCRFSLLASEAGMRGGASGACQTSKGAKISASS